MHWSNASNQAMDQHMHDIALEAIKFDVGIVQYLLFTCDEVLWTINYKGNFLNFNFKKKDP